MSLSYKCPDCESEMTLSEDTHVCPKEECGKTLSIDEATELFDSGEIVAIVDESTAEENAKKDSEIIVADISEDVAALVSSENLSEEFAAKAKTIMETAIKSHVAAAVATITEEKETQLAEAVEAAREELVEKIDGYLDHVVTEWMTQNEIAIESGIKSEMNEKFLSGLAGLLKEHYVEAPEERWDIVEGLAEKVEDLEGKLDTAITENIASKKEILVVEKATALLKLSEGLADTQAEKLVSLAESVEAATVEDFVAQVTTLKESYFDDKSTDNPKKIDEDHESEENAGNKVSSIDAAVKMLNRKF